jgi:hypothetical protein
LIEVFAVAEPVCVLVSLLVAQEPIVQLLKKLVAAAEFLLAFLDADGHGRRAVAGRNALVAAMDLPVVLSRLFVRSCSSEKLPLALLNAISKWQ